MTMTLATQERDRTKIADDYKWNLADVYPDAAAWRARKEAIAGEIPSVRAFEGRLGHAAGTLADALRLALTDPSPLRRAASSAADLLRRAFSVDRMVRETVAVYGTP